MCFRVTNKKEYTATKNIPCWKHGTKIEEYFISSVKDYRYEYGKPYNLKRKLTIEVGNYIEEGYHSFTKLSKAKDSAFVWDEEVVKCIIPKGAKYYKDEICQEYVSNQIIIKG